MQPTAFAPGIALAITSSLAAIDQSLHGQARFEPAPGRLTRERFLRAQQEAGNRRLRQTLARLFAAAPQSRTTTAGSTR